MIARLCSAALLSVLLGCSSESHVRLELHNDTGAKSGVGTLGIQDVMPVTSASSTSHFSMRLASVYLVEDVDPQSQNNSGAVGSIWKSPHCSGPSDCDFFELARPTDEVNADLASQELAIDPATYRYVRLEFCAGGPSGPNVAWQGDGMGAPHEFMVGMCGVTSAEFTPPLVLKSGDSVAVSLGYDLAGSSVVGDVTADSPATTPALTAPDGHGVGYQDCAAQADPAKKTCFNVPAFHPTAAMR
jgi:hypothetical protein